MGKPKAKHPKPAHGKQPASEVLFLRVPRGLLEALDAKVASEVAEHPGRSVSRADIARELLWRALEGA